MAFLVHFKFIFGIAGDGLTFLGGAVLAWDALRSPDAYKERRELTEALRRLAGLAIEDRQGAILSTESDVNLSELRAAKRRAKIGFLLMTLGFLFLLLTRMAEP